MNELNDTHFFEKIKEWFKANQDIYEDYKKNSDNYRNEVGTLLYYCKEHIFNPNSLEYRPVTQEHEDLISGKKRVTLEDIKNYMINELSKIANNYKVTKKSHDEDDEWYGEDGSGYYDSAGHCGAALFEAILRFWENFNTNNIRDLNGVVGMDYTDDIDLDGGRDYLLSHSDFALMAFNYYYYTLNWKKEQIEKIIWNSGSVNEDVEDLYPPEIPDPSTLDKYRIQAKVTKFELKPGMSIKKISFTKDSGRYHDEIECRLEFENSYKVTLLYKAPWDSKSNSYIDHELEDDKYPRGIYEWDGKKYIQIEDWDNN